MAIMSTELEHACQQIVNLPHFLEGLGMRMPVVHVDDPVVLESLDVMNREKNTQLASDVAQKMMYLASTGLLDQGGSSSGTSATVPAFMLRPGDKSSKDSSINKLLVTLPYVSQIPSWPVQMDSDGNITSWMRNPFSYAQVAVNMDDIESLDNVTPCQKNYVVTLDPCQTARAGITNENYMECLTYWDDIFAKPSANGHCYSSATVTNPVTGATVAMAPTSSQHAACLQAGGDDRQAYSPDYDPAPDDDDDDDGGEVIPPDDDDDDDNDDIMIPPDDDDDGTDKLSSTQKLAVAVSVGVAGLLLVGVGVGLLAWKAGSRRTKE
jgi:hypothetical protein